MVTNLDKMRKRYEKIIQELGLQSERFDMLNRVDPAVCKEYMRTKEIISDRELELDFLKNEIQSIDASLNKKREQQDQNFLENTQKINDLTRFMQAKQQELKKTQTKLAGAEYDLRFVVKSLENEQAKAKEAKNLEQLSKAKRYEANVKRLKIDVLKRRGTIKSVQNEIKKLENIISERAKEIGELEELVEKIVVEQKEQKKKKSKNKSQEEEMRDELVRQHHNKEEEILQSRKHMQDLLADAGEDLYRIRIRHPVLEKYYAELDRVTKKIKEFEK